jgi:molecular chaperone GrpE
MHGDGFDSMTDESKDQSVEEQEKKGEGGETQDALAAMTAERDRYKEAALRALADLDNYRKRAIRERDEYSKKAREDLLREFLPVFDNLERAAQFVSQGADAAAIGKGVEMVLKLFEDTLVRVGGKRLRPVGQAFDPQVHEAISQQPSEHPAGVVAAEAIAGYLLGDRLLRAAMVVVSTGPSEKKEESTPSTSASSSGEADERASKPSEDEPLEFDPSKG